MLTVTQLARRCGLSRGTLLYYESIGVLRPPARSAANYRRYGERDLERLRQVVVWRNAGLALADIRSMLDRPGTDASAILQRRLAELSDEIGRLRGHQQAILRLLQAKPSFGRSKVMTKEKWVSIMKSAGFSEGDMLRWHTEFERSAPEDHQQFLEYLHIEPVEISSIRQWSRTGERPAV